VHLRGVCLKLSRLLSLKPRPSPGIDDLDRRRAGGDG